MSAHLPNRPPGSGGPKQGLESLYSRNRETRKKNYKQKLLGRSVLVGADHIFGPKIWIR
jgi:hypothetical protein